MSQESRQSKPANGLMRALKSAQTWVAICSLIGVVLIALVDVDRTSPGQITSVHAALNELENGANCSACHGGLFSGMTDSCLECHEVIEGQLEASAGLHGTFTEEDAGRCVLCHSEHHGEGFALVNTQSFARAGVADADNFDHELLGFKMDGQHLELDCTECHMNAEVAVLPEGERRFIGLDPKCVRCHDDPHDGRMVRSCTTCHDQSGFENRHMNNHRENLPLVGGHRDLDCRTCHAEDEDRSLENLARGLGQLQARSCRDCHAAPHGEEFLAEVALETGLTPGASCVTCHVEEHRSFRGDGEPEAQPGIEATLGIDALRTLTDLVTPELHAAAGFTLALPHGELDCTQCHGDEQQDFDLRFLDRDEDACSVCHAEPHDGQFTRGIFADEECTKCHRREEFTRHQFGSEAHAETNFPLSGTHVATECSACHFDPPEDQARVFSGTEMRCEQCHTDAHGGFFDGALATLPAPQTEGTCAECHLPTSFDDVLLEDEIDELGGDEASGQSAIQALSKHFEHGTWTGFEIRGSHAQADCEACHPRASVADEHGRRFGRVEEHFGEQDGCVSCHADPHGGIFDQRSLPRNYKGQAGCLRCHVETSFRALPHGFDHQLWTNFRLDGAHEDAACAACHVEEENSNLRDRSGLTRAHAVGSNCNDCHADPHAGQFDTSGVTDCARCHRSAVGWDVLRFDHDRHSSFRLGDAHAKVACSDCHKGWELESGAEIVRYRPLETDCASCHGSQRGRTLRRRGSRD